MKENLAEKYYLQMENSLTPALDLAEFFCSLYDRTVTKEEVQLITQLLKIFDRFIVHNAIVVLGTHYYKVTNSQSAVNLLKGICKRSLEDRLKNKEIDYVNMTDELKKLVENK